MSALGPGGAANPAPCDGCPVRRWPVFKPLAEAELDFIRGMLVAQHTVAPEADILREGQGGPLYTLWDGWAYRYKPVGLGQPGRRRGRQILDILLPGDLIGLETALTGEVRHSVRALTEATVCVHSPRAFLRVFDECPSLARAVVETVVRDHRRADGHAVRLGRLNAVQRLAHLMLDLRDRLAQRGLLRDGGGERCPFPLQRRHLADALGLSGTHVARSLAALQETGLAEVADGGLVIHDRARLSALAGYEPFDGMGGRAIL